MIIVSSHALTIITWFSLSLSLSLSLYSLVWGPAPLDAKGRVPRLRSLSLSLKMSIWLSVSLLFSSLLPLALSTTSNIDSSCSDILTHNDTHGRLKKYIGFTR